MGLVLGVGIDNLRAFVFDRYRAEGWARFVAGLSPSDGAIASTAEGAQWYELALLARLRRALDACFGCGDLALCEELGRYEADRDLGHGIMRFFFWFISPERAVRCIDRYWRRFHQSGSWTVEEPKRGEIVARLSGWDVVDEALCRHLVGYFGRTLEIIGNRSSSVRHRACRAHGGRCCEFVWSWGLQPAPSTPAPVPQGDMLPMVMELMELTDLDDVGRAIGDLCVGRLGCRHVTLWDDRSGGGTPLVRLGQTSPGNDARCVVLTARGEAVGRLEVETEKGAPPNPAFDQLTRSFGLALAGAQPNQDAVCARRVTYAKAQLGLTERQADVIALVARGLQNKEIAARLSIEPGTVEIHVTGILRRARLENRASLVAWFWSFPPPS
jgi:DNA-binding CsgD family transcriptional regulator